MVPLKYKLIRVGKQTIHRTEERVRFYRVQAIRDIPEHNVKAGDIGGYVTQKYSLSQEGSCWVGGEAQLVGSVYLEDNAYVGNKALVRVLPGRKDSEDACINITHNAKVLDNATVKITPGEETRRLGVFTQIKDNTVIFENAVVNNANIIKDASKIYGDAQVTGIRNLSGSSEIYGKAIILKGAYICDNSKISGTVFVETDAWIQGSIISGDARVLKGKSINYGNIDEGAVSSIKDNVSKKIDEKVSSSKEALKVQDISVSPKEQLPPLPEVNLRPGLVKLISKLSGSRETDIPEVGKTKSVSNPEIIQNLYAELCESIEAYTTDIVKIIKYPVMTDRTDEYTLKMMTSLKAIQRIDAAKNPTEFSDAVFALEEAFMRAESNAEKIASSLLSDADKKKTSKAKDLFRIAANDASSEQERKAAFIQGFKQLEGVIAVPEIAVDTFRVKLGLKEIETLG